MRLPPELIKKAACKFCLLYILSPVILNLELACCENTKQDNSCLEPTETNKRKLSEIKVLADYFDVYSVLSFLGLELASRQNAKQDTTCLPSLNISGTQSSPKISVI